jgi:hypothetical protein
MSEPTLVVATDNVKYHIEVDTKYGWVTKVVNYQGHEEVRPGYTWEEFVEHCNRESPWKTHFQHVLKCVRRAKNLYRKDNTLKFFVCNPKSIRRIDTSSGVAEWLYYKI